MGGERVWLEEKGFGGSRKGLVGVRRVWWGGVHGTGQIYSPMFIYSAPIVTDMPTTPPPTPTVYPGRPIGGAGTYAVGGSGPGVQQSYGGGVSPIATSASYVMAAADAVNLPQSKTRPFRCTHLVKTRPFRCLVKRRCTHLVKTRPFRCTHLVKTCPFRCTRLVKTRPFRCTHLVKTRPFRCTRLVKTRPFRYTRLVKCCISKCYGLPLFSLRRDLSIRYLSKHSSSC